MRKKFEEDLSADKSVIKIIKCSQTIKPNLTSITFWLTWYGQLVSMVLDKQTVVETGNEISAFIRCTNRHNQNENGERCKACAKVKH